MQFTYWLQRALVKHGYMIAVDGAYGPQTSNALRKFQIQFGLPVTGTATKETVTALRKEPTDRKERVTEPVPTTHNFPWLDETYRVKGLHERRNKSRLWAWLRLGSNAVADPAKVPWCAALTQSAIRQTLPDEATPNNPFLALNWLKFGRAVDPCYGCILVFWRGSPKSWKGHIGFYVGEDATHYHVLGGNQSNAVTVSRIKKSRLRKNGARWPSTFAHSDTVVVADGSELIETTNEA